MFELFMNNHEFPSYLKVVQLLLCNQSFIHDKKTHHKKMFLNFHIHLYLIAYNL